MLKTRTLSRYLAQGLVSLLLILLVAACGGTTGPNGTGGPTKITIQVLDGGGVLNVLKAVLQNYKTSHPNTIVDIKYVTTTAPVIPGKIQAQISAGKQDFSLILGGYDVVAAGIKDGFLEQLTPAHSDKFPNVSDNYQGPAAQYAGLAQGYALPIAYTPSGPLFEYDPSKVPNPPQTIDQLRTWIKAHPGKFEYARPRNSGPGRTMLMGLPYLLKDSNPKDPVHGWTNTWSFLKDIGSSIDYYPARTGVTMTELGNDTRWMIATTMGWDINPRVLGQVPQGFKTFMLQGTSFVADDLFMMMPKGLDAQHKAVILDMISYALQPKQQAYTYDKGYFYPGPAIKNVPLAMAPASSQTALQTFGRPEYDQLATTVPIM
nr:extracellular solute-binding protein [Chloroflexota bacterium]